LAMKNKKNGLDKHRVSIGMPVFNGEKFIQEALDSILNQTFSNFELIISDNASTDRTQEICLNYASRDERVHYYRNEKNLGGPQNYNRVFELSSGEYFKWAAYDDVLAPTFLEKCVFTLDNDKSIFGCFCKTGRIDQTGNFLGYHNENLLKNIGSPKVHERFRELLNLYYITTPFHGVYRSSLFSKSQRHGSYIGADRNLVAELSLMGRIYEIPECLFFWREHPNSYTSIFYGSVRDNTLDRLQKEIAWWSREGGTYFPHWKNCVEYFRSVNNVPLKLSDRFLCYIQIFDWILKEGHRFMANDIVLFLFQHSSIANMLIRKTNSFLTPSLKSKLFIFF
jgi:glycosyltransferase involved in cell wall biosynthesis